MYILLLLLLVASPVCAQWGYGPMMYGSPMMMGGYPGMMGGYGGYPMMGGYGGYPMMGGYGGKQFISTVLLQTWQYTYSPLP